MSSKPHREDLVVADRHPNAPVTRSTVSPRVCYSDYRDDLRYDFFYHCAYCTLSEAEAQAISFSIDHYLPQSRYPELCAVYENLMWCCEACNRFELDGPSATHARRGLRFVRPDLDDPDEHIALSSVSRTRVEPKSANVGEYTIERLNLNREPLRRMREIRAKLDSSSARILRGIQALRGHSVQDLPKHERARYLATGIHLCKQAVSTKKIVDAEVVRALSRSPLIADGGHKASPDEEKRRRYLARMSSPLAPRVSTVIL